MNLKEKHPSASERHIPVSRDCHLLGNSFRRQAKTMLHLSHKFPSLVLHLRICQSQMASISQLPVKLKIENLQEDVWAALGFPFVSKKARYLLSSLFISAASIFKSLMIHTICASRSQSDFTEEEIPQIPKSQLISWESAVKKMRYIQIHASFGESKGGT